MIEHSFLSKADLQHLAPRLRYWAIFVFCLCVILCCLSLSFISEPLTSSLVLERINTNHFHRGRVRGWKRCAELGSREREMTENIGECIESDGKETVQRWEHEGTNGFKKVSKREREEEKGAACGWLSKRKNQERASEPKEELDAKATCRREFRNLKDGVEEMRKTEWEQNVECSQGRCPKGKTGDD